MMSTTRYQLYCRQLVIECEEQHYSAEAVSMQFAGSIICII